jgi:hypothetical protein
MSATDQHSIASVNAEAIEAWDGPLFDRFVPITPHRRRRSQPLRR